MDIKQLYWRSCSVWSSVISPQRPWRKSAPAGSQPYEGSSQGHALRENCMLKVNFSETPAEERWILHGRLTEPWVHEFKACWKKNHRRDVARACIVDLNEVTFIDKCGERVLRMLARRGAQFTASGMYTKHILEQITARRRTRRSASKT
jgi:predicted nucleic acid-binding Zn ribbon protein